MKSNYTFIILFLLANFFSIIAQQSEITTVVIVRHAEKESPAENMQAVEMSKQGDVKLTKMGEQRAVKLAEMLSESKVSTVFSTNTIRTIETVNNYADKNGIEIILYDDAGELAKNIMSDYAGEKILVSAHSNTIGSLMKLLGTDSVPNIEHDYYSGFFIVTIAPGGNVSWLHLEY
jgi:broad specificity phosphatase PhoE